MASTLNSNSFLLTTSPSSRLGLKSKRLRVFAKSKAAEEGDAGNSGPFRFDFGKVADMKSLVPLVSKPAAGLSFRRKDEATVFVAGAAGQTGARIAQTLLREGFTVRAGVSDLAAAQDLARLAAKYKIISNEESKRLNAVESSFGDSESIAKAIGNASKVVVTVGPAEDGPTQAVSTSDALAVFEAAQLAGVGHVAIVCDGNGSPAASTYNVLDGLTSFFNNLFAKSQPLTVQQLLQKVIQTDVKYTLIKTSLTEDFSPESAYNIVVSAEGTAGANDYKVAKSQIASLVAKIFSDTAVAENKVVEVTTDPSAPSKSIADLFSSIPEDGRRAAYAEAQAKAEAEEAAQKAKMLEEQATNPPPENEPEPGPEAQQGPEAAGLAIDGLLSKAKDIGAGFSWDKLSSQLSTTIAQNGPEPGAEPEPEAQPGLAIDGLLSKAKGIGAGFSWEKLNAQLSTATAQKAQSEGTTRVQIATVRGQAKARTLPSLRAVVKPKSPSPAPVAAKKKAAAPKRGKAPAAAPPKKAAEVRNVFGGLFKQETIYVDDE